MDFRGTWLPKQHQEGKASKPLVIVDILGDDCIGPNDVRISKVELQAKYTKSDPFSNIQNIGMLGEFIDKSTIAPQTEAPVATTGNIEVPIVNLPHKPIQAQQIQQTPQTTPEEKLLDAMMLLNPSATSKQFTVDVILPISLDVLKSLTSSTEMDPKKFIALMLSKNSEVVLDSIASSIYESISTTQYEFFQPNKQSKTRIEEI